MEQPIIETIYKILINNLPITNKTMEQYGLTEGDINKLIEDNEITLKKDKTYNLVRVDNFRKYGVHLLEEKKAYEANVCFKKCYELLPNSKKVVFQLILAKIIRKNYEEAFEIYLNYEKMQITVNKKENDLFVWLFSYITDYPTESHERVLEINPEDLLLPYSQTNYIDNKIRLSISMHKFKYAYKLIVDQAKKENDNTTKTEVLRSLVNRAIDVEKYTKLKILELSKKEEYKEIIFTLLQIQNRRRLSKLEKGILTTTKAIYDLETYHRLPKPKPGYVSDMYDAIETHEFKFALELNQEFLNHIKAEDEYNPISILLTKINNLIDGTESKEKEEINNNQCDEDSYEIKTSITDLEKLESLANFILNGGESLEAATKKLALSNEQVQLIKLILARNCYIEGQYIEGDKILHCVESRIENTEEVKNYIQEVKKYKQLYQDSETKVKRLKKILN